MAAIAPATYYEQRRRREHQETSPPRVQRDAKLSREIQRVFDENFRVYGVRNVWRQMLREGHDVARCTVERLMKKMGLEGVIRGKRVRTTVPVKDAPRLIALTVAGRSLRALYLVMLASPFGVSVRTQAITQRVRIP